MFFFIEQALDNSINCTLVQIGIAYKSRHGIQFRKFLDYSVYFVGEISWYRKEWDKSIKIPGGYKSFLFVGRRLFGIRAFRKRTTPSSIIPCNMESAYGSDYCDVSF